MGGRRRVVAFQAGLVAILVAVAPPIEHLAEALASAHMVQHVLLILVAAPLLAISGPVDLILGLCPRSVRKAVGRFRRRVGATPARLRRPLRPFVVWLAYGGTLWFWHASGPYELAVENTAVHIGEHLAFLLAALAFWSMVLRSRRSGGPSRGYRVLMVFTTAFHSVLLAALITFARSPWYSVYEGTSPSWGLDPLPDQQLAGLIMWIPGGLLYTAVGLALIVPWVQEHETGDAIAASR